MLRPNTADVWYASPINPFPRSCINAENRRRDLQSSSRRRRGESDGEVCFCVGMVLTSLSLTFFSLLKFVLSFIKPICMYFAPLNSMVWLVITKALPSPHYLLTFRWICDLPWVSHHVFLYIALCESVVLTYSYLFYSPNLMV